MNSTILNGLSDVPRREGVSFLSDPAPHADAEERYWAVRTREGRIYPDETVRALPWITPDHPLAPEWRARVHSCARLTRYLARRRAPFGLLEVGCGNGWLSHRLASLRGAQVVGLDLNQRELAQAARVFADVPRLRFVYADVFTARLPEHAWGVIVVASAIQYFSDLPGLVQRLLALLAPGGELHLLDSPLYSPAEVEAACTRSQAYYAALGLPEAAKAYHHHTLDSLQPFHPTILYDPQRGWDRFLRRLPFLQRSPFPWLRFTA